MTSTQLTRDCPAVQIPQGTTVTLPRGTVVHISQTLGGTYTVHAQGALFRITGQDADALGLEVKPTATPEAVAAAPEDLSEDQVRAVLKTCFDPEIPLNIVDLGLVYDLTIEKLPPGSHRVNMRMTLTAPGCGMGTVIAQDAQEKLVQLPGVAEANVEIVWEPPWHQSMISPEGRRVLGLE